MYNADNAQKIKTQSKLEPDKVYETVIVQINDGTVKQFLPEQSHSQWKGDLEQTAIEIVCQVQNQQTQEVVEVTQIFPYVEEDGVTKYSESSNLAKFEKKYGSLPKVSQIIKVATNGDGKPKIKID